MLELMGNRILPLIANITPGHSAGALWELHDVAETAKSNKLNCKELVRFSQDILRILDAQGDTNVVLERLNNGIELFMVKGLLQLEELWTCHLFA
jgi:hypothetical protein